MITNRISRRLAIACILGISVAGCSATTQAVKGQSAQDVANASIQAGRHVDLAQAQPSTPPSPPVIATAAPAQHPGLKLAINSLHRDSSGVVVLTWTVTNGSSERFIVSPGTFADPISKYAAISVSTSGVTLLDKDESVRYHPLRDANLDYCVCSDVPGTGGHALIEPGRSADYFDTYTLPASVSKATVEVPGFVGVKDVPIK